MNKVLLSSLLLTLSVANAGATIHYRSLNQTDVSLFNRHVQVDIDFDGVSDFEFDATTLQNDRNCNVLALSQTNTFLCNASTLQPVGLQSGQGLGGSSNVYSNVNMGATSMASSYNGGQFENATRYLMVRFVSSGVTHYGWVYLTATSNVPQMTLLGCAYNDVANQTILPGQGDPTGVKSVGETPVLNFALSTNKLNIYSLGVAIQVDFYITDMSGKKVFEKVMDRPGSNSLDLAPGAYIVSVMDKVRGTMISSTKVTIAN